MPCRYIDTKTLRIKIQKNAKFLQKLATFLKIVYNYIRIVVISMKKVITILFIILFVCCFNINKTYASDKWSKHQEEWWNPKFENSEFGSENIANKANVIIKAIRNIGIVVAVIALMVIGAREMF